MFEKVKINRKSVHTLAHSVLGGWQRLNSLRSIICHLLFFSICSSQRWLWLLLLLNVENACSVAMLNSLSSSVPTACRALLVEDLTEVWVFLDVHLWEELVPLLELRCVVCWEAVFWDLHRGLGLVGVLHEVADTRNAASHCQHTSAIVDTDHQVIYLVHLRDAWQGKPVNCCAVELISVSKAVAFPQTIFLVLWNALKGCINLRRLLVVEVYADFVGIDVDVLGCCRLTQSLWAWCRSALLDNLMWLYQWASSKASLAARLGVSIIIYTCRVWLACPWER